MFQDALLSQLAHSDEQGEAEKPGHRKRLQVASSAAIDYALAIVEGEDAGQGIPPMELLAQARQAARQETALHVVIRRYLSGYHQFCGWLIEEANSIQIGASLLQELLRSLADAFDELCDVISQEYLKEAGRCYPGTDGRLLRDIKRLLRRGTRVSPARLDYDFAIEHLALVGEGSAARDAVKALAAATGSRYLIVNPDRDGVWGWISGRRLREDRQLIEVAMADCFEGLPIGVGEPAKGLKGWRESHFQAEAAFPAAFDHLHPMRYADIGMTVCITQDALYTAFLHDRYIAPMGDDKQGEKLRQTLQAYYKGGRSQKAAAATLGITRQAVSQRLAQVMERLADGSGVDSLELELAVSLAARSAIRVPEREFGRGEGSAIL